MTLQLLSYVVNRKALVIEKLISKILALLFLCFKKDWELPM